MRPLLQSRAARQAPTDLQQSEERAAQGPRRAAHADLPQGSGRVGSGEAEVLLCRGSHGQRTPRSWGSIRRLAIWQANRLIPAKIAWRRQTSGLVGLGSTRPASAKSGLSTMCFCSLSQGLPICTLAVNSVIISGRNERLLCPSDNKSSFFCEVDLRARVSTMIRSLGNSFALDLIAGPRAPTKPSDRCSTPRRSAWVAGLAS